MLFANCVSFTNWMFAEPDAIIGGFRGFYRNRGLISDGAALSYIHGFPAASATLLRVYCFFAALYSASPAVQASAVEAAGSSQQP